jgi:hypothetical protein
MAPLLCSKYEPCGTYSCEVCECHTSRRSEPQIVHKQDLDAEYTDLARHSNAQWLNLDKSSRECGTSRNIIFFDMKNKYIMLPQLKDENWKIFMVFLLAVSENLTQLKCRSSKERRHCTRVTYGNVGFQNKSASLLQAAKENKFTYFSTLRRTYEF